jgi:hypothetical protein
MAMLVITRWYIPVFSVVVVVSAARMILEPAADAAPQWFPAVDQLGFVEFHIIVQLQLNFMESSSY